jgi:hypothetical protein
MANRVGDAAEGESEVAATDIIPQADTVATGAAGIALSGQAVAGPRAIAIADAFSVRSADAAAVGADEITGPGTAIGVARALR